MQKMSEQAPGELLVEKYLVEIAKSHNVDYKPNSDLAIRDPDFFYNSSNNNGSNGGVNYFHYFSSHNKIGTILLTQF